MQAHEYLKNVEQSEKLKGTNLVTKCASIILLATQSSSIPKSMKDMLRHSEVKKKDLTRCFKRVKDVLKLRHFLKPEDCVKQIGGRLKLDVFIETLAARIAQNITKTGKLEGRNPYTIAGTAVAYANKFQSDAKKSVTIDRISEASGMAVATIRTGMSKTREHRFEIIPKDMIPGDRVREVMGGDRS